MASRLPAAAAAASPATWAKAALRRLAESRLEPTPDNYARAYAEESGQAPLASSAAPAPAAAATAVDTKAQGAAWAGLIERVARHLDRGGRQWTPARRKDSLQRVLAGSRSDPGKLQQRLGALLTAWETDRQDDPAETGFGDFSTEPATPPADAAHDPVPGAPPAAPPSADVRHAREAREPRDVAAPGADWLPLVQTLQGTLRAGLPPAEPRAALLADELAALADALAADGITAAHLATAQALCARVQRLFAHRHHLVDELGQLCRELTLGLTELAEEDSWARGQCEHLQLTLGQTVDGAPAAAASARGVRATGQLLAETRQRQQRVQRERQAARDAFKAMFQRMVDEAQTLGEHAGQFEASVGRHADAIAGADSLESLAGVVRTMLDDSRAVQSAVSASRQRLQDDQARAEALQARVRELEGELRRLSDEVSTDALTQVANRRGLAQAFAALQADAARQRHTADDGQAPASGLAVGLLDIDNFKKLNDSLGHAAGDMALKALATAVRERLRPIDHLARFGGEEFVVLLPQTPLAEAQQALTRLQRGLSAGLFMHDGNEVFVTFSAGVTRWQPGETLEAALERADEALYEAKRTGKNRTCVA